MKAAVVRRGRNATGSCRASPTSAGRRMVNVEPRPGALSTVMSPPISRQNRRLMASPSPVPCTVNPFDVPLPGDQPRRTAVPLALTISMPPELPVWIDS